MNLIHRTIAIMLMLIGTYYGTLRDEYARAAFYISFACFAEIAAMESSKEGGSK